MRTGHFKGIVTFLLVFVSATCSAFGVTYTVGGKVAGLKAAESVTLVDNAKTPLKVSANGAFTFPAGLATGAAYAVTVSVQPKGQICTVAKGTGKIAAANVTTVAVTCKAAYTVGGTLSSLKTGAKLILLDNAANALTLTKNAAFTFTVPVATGAKYAVTVGTQPAGQLCTVTKGTGTVAAANITTVAVACKLAYSIGGTLTGLKAGDTVTLENNGKTPLELTKTGAFKFTTDELTGAKYAVTVSVQPAGQKCTVTKGTGTVAAANITTVAVACVTPATSFSIGGNVSGLTTGQKVTLLDNGGDAKIVSANGAFTFATKIATGKTYAVTVGAQPTGATCAVTKGSGTVAAANIITVAVACKPTAATTYSIGGNVSGLVSGASVALFDNGGDLKTVTANGAFTFATKLATAKTYAVTIATPPVGETCTVTAGSGTVAAANITTVAVACTPATYFIGGQVTGLVSGSVTLLDNGGNATVVSSNESFLFTTKIASGSKYAVTVGTQPAFQTCTVSAGSGTVAGGNVNNVAIACKANNAGSFSIGGNVTGLTGTVVLLDNGGDSKSISANGAFTFATKIPSAETYAVTVGTQPTGYTCAITNGSGTVNASNITNVAVACTKNAGGGGGAGHYWMSYNSSPTNSAADGQTGLFLIASDKITTAPAPQYVTADATSILSSTYDIGTGPPITLTPARLIYSDTNSSGVTHIYGLVLDDTSKFPTPVQISNIALSSTQAICSNDSAQTDLTDPTSVFILLEVGDAPDCGTTSTMEVIHYKDSPTTAPVVVGIDSGGLDTQYNGSTLVGLLHLNNTTGNLDLYANDTFTSPTHLVSNVQYYSSIDGTTFNFNDPLSSKTNLFLNLNTTNASFPTGLYYLPASSTTVSKVHAGTIGDTATDDNNLYFLDVSSKTQTLFYQVPLGNGTVKLLYTGTTGTVTTASSQTITNDDLIGSNDSLVVYQQSIVTYNLTAGTQTATTAFFTLPVGASTSTPKQIGATYPNFLTFGTAGFLASASDSGLPGSKLFVNLVGVTVTNPMTDPMTTYAYSSLVLPLDGSSSPTPTKNSTYESLGLSALISNSGVWRGTGITDTDGGYGGATINQTDVESLTDTPFKTVGGGSFVLTPKTYSGYISVFVVEGSDGTGPGEMIPVHTGSQASSTIGAAVDTINNFIYPIAIKDTDIAIF